MLEDVLNRMNAAQYQATTSDATVLQILAGPGSGKTRVLTTRVAWLVKERNVDPDTILVVTFTNKAANEMRNRLQTNDLLGSESMRLMMGTFHSKCSALLRRYGNRIGIRSNFTIADTAASDKILETVLKELPSEFRAFGKPSTYRGAISKAKAQDMTCDIYDAEHRDDLKEGSAKLKTSIVYRAYQKELLNNNALDFDDLLMEGCRLLEKDPSIADSIGYILVDEYQDTNLVQYNLIKLLSRGGKHITIVGDPDQSIYGFRNADVSNFRKMQTDYDNVVTINLEENYRSTTHILDAASVVIQHDTDRLPKSLYTNNCLGVPISWLALPTPDEEAKEIVNEIVRLEKYSNGILTHDDFCILVRINSHSRPYESALNEMKIPYRMRGGLRFFDRAEVKDVIAYLRLVSNPYDSEAFTRIINVPKRGIGDVTVKRIKALAERKHLSMLDALAEFANTGGGSSANRSLPQATVNEMGRFLKMMNSFRALAEAQTSIGIITETVIRESNIQKYLQNKYAKDGKEIFKIHWSNIEELLNFAQRFNESSSDQSNISQTNSSQASTQRANSSANTQNVDALVRFLDSTSLDLDSTNEEEENDTKQLVTISTYHSAKGLEWPCVFATGCEEGVIPFVLCTSEKEIQEECRLLYVGMTRAQCFLYVTEVTSRYNPCKCCSVGES
ncbi:ATP-dependent DNA helicase PcrA [Umbelopsis sp. PMI_123]|nr:ATP-dependent DNA helicase PcrA [Umbelopsis sp. PMI_123]